ncbi:hypothetical protein RHGRI_013616 [Rhododendron griersonianum]|uniref:Uncharacterized protein n=1 Tax=Rhododendron griersonianum TaxID=479676 RepID=A0AAV6K6J2_9ERIC|nr:hypothetical protein RHGRI_013616 [Rhododendron griersonianum]
MRVTSCEGTVHVWNSQTGKLISIFAESYMSYVHASSPLTSPSKINVDHSNMLNSNPPSSGMLSSAFDGSLYTCMHHLQFNEKLVVGTRNGSLRYALILESDFHSQLIHKELKIRKMRSSSCAVWSLLMVLFRADSLMFREIKNFISRRLNLEPHGWPLWQPMPQFLFSFG